MMNLGLVNVRSWKIGKLEEICDEMNKADLDFLAITQTNLRGNIDDRFKEYKMLCKGREYFTKQGGGVGLIYKESKGYVIEQIELDTTIKEGEDIVGYRCQGQIGEKGEVGETFILFVCYMTVEGPNSDENSKKYEILQNCINKYADEKILVMGDFNGHK